MKIYATDFQIKIGIFKLYKCPKCREGGLKTDYRFCPYCSEPLDFSNVREETEDGEDLFEKS